MCFGCRYARHTTDSEKVSNNIQRGKKHTLFKCFASPQGFFHSDIIIRILQPTPNIHPCNCGRKKNISCVIATMDKDAGANRPTCSMVYPSFKSVRQRCQSPPCTKLLKSTFVTLRAITAVFPGHQNPSRFSSGNQNKHGSRSGSFLEEPASPSS